MIQWPTGPEFIRQMPDADLIAAYGRTTGNPADAEAEALLAEIQRRELDI